MGQINGRALAAAGIGSLFVWSGIKGWSVLGTIGDAITGVAPSENVTVPLQLGNPATTTNGTAQTYSVFGGSAGSVLAQTAMQYQGHAYRFGGAPGPDLANPWDCSSFVNAIAAIKLGLAIPGYKPGKYTGTTHGPPTGSWAVWNGMVTIPRASVQAGDILVWLGHMGIAIDNTRMISALNPREGTKVGNIDAGVGRGPLVRIGRLK